MKKTLSVTLGGRAYTIHEDAYHALDVYVNKIRAQFKDDQNVDELVADMEAGMADTFAKHMGKRKDAVLTVADVEAMIEVMGAPEEIADEEPVAPGGKTAKGASHQNHEGATGSAPGQRRFYRSTDDVVIAGVCSGIAAYFNIDPVIVRIGFILLAFVNGIGIIAYLILWAAMPKAETTAQKLEMRGKPVNISEIEELVKEKAHMMRDEGKKAIERLRDRQTQSTIQKILQIPVQVVEAIMRAVRAVLRAVGPILSVFVGVLLTIVSGALLLALSVTAGMVLFGIQSPSLHSAVPLEALTSNPLYYVGLGSLFLVVLIPLVLLLTLAITLLMRRNLFRGAAVGVMAVVWVLAIGTAAGTGTHLIPEIQEHAAAYSAAHTVTQEFAIEGNVERLRVTGNAHVRVIQGDVVSATFRGWEEDLERVTLSVEDGELHIDQQESERQFLCLFCQRLRPHGELVLPVLSLEIIAEDTAHIDATFENAETVRVIQTDASRVTLEGTAVLLFSSIEDTARLLANDLRADTVDIMAGDYGRASVRTSGALTATAEDMARITYRGNPATSTIQELDFGRVRDAYED